MRKNFPVYDVETVVREDQFLISRTDTKGRITYANPAFVTISGFSREELLGSPHNIVRHPDMPPQAYEDLWDTIQSGRSWLGVAVLSCGAVSGFLSCTRESVGDSVSVKAYTSPVEVAAAYMPLRA